MTKTTKAMHVDGTALTSNDVRDINKVAKLLTKYGAISVERTAHLTKMSVISASWCLFMTGALPTASGLYIWH